MREWRASERDRETLKTGEERGRKREETNQETEIEGERVAVGEEGGEALRWSRRQDLPCLPDRNPLIRAHYQARQATTECLLLLTHTHIIAHPYQRTDTHTHTHTLIPEDRHTHTHTPIPKDSHIHTITHSYQRTDTHTHWKRDYKTNKRRGGVTS